MAGISQVTRLVARDNEMNVTVLIEIDRLTDDGLLIMWIDEKTQFEIEILIQSTCQDSPAFKSFEKSLTASFAAKRNYDRVKMTFTSKPGLI